MPARPTAWYWITLAFFAGVGYAFALQQLMRPLTPDGLHFHPWSSEDMMQTVSLAELRRQPLESLTHIHIQPPAFDAIRAALAQFWPTLTDSAVLRRVDLALYVIGAILFGLMVALVYAWLAAQAGALAGLAGAVMVLLHPASIMFATFLDSTLLSAVLFLSNYYLLWRIKNQFPTPIWLFSAAVLALFFTRSIYQWPALMLFAICLWLVGAPRHSVIAYILVTGVLGTLYLVKQYSQFGILSTSSLSGVSLANSIGVGMGTAKYSAYLDQPSLPTLVESGMPGVLTAPTKLAGRPNFNHIDYLNLNRQLSARFVQTIQDDSLGHLMRNYVENTRIYFRPSSSYSSGHVILEHLPWRSAYDHVFSAPVLTLMLMLAFIAWALRAIRTHTIAASLGILLPGLFVMLVSILADKGENMRFKFFVEPVMIVFLVSQAAILFSRARIGLDKAQFHGPRRSSR